MSSSGKTVHNHKIDCVTIRGRQTGKKDVQRDMRPESTSNRQQLEEPSGSLAGVFVLRVDWSVSNKLSGVLLHQGPP